MAKSLGGLLMAINMSAGELARVSGDLSGTTNRLAEEWGTVQNQEGIKQALAEAMPTIAQEISTAKEALKQVEDMLQTAQNWQ